MCIRDRLEEDERKMFLEDLGLTESGLEKLIAASYHLLGLISYLTAGPTETRAWTIKVGTKAPQAAGKIHSDFERGFIKAEVVNYQDLLDCGTYTVSYTHLDVYKRQPQTRCRGCPFPLQPS